MFKEENITYLDFDIYSQRISFFYKNKEKIGSTFGFILTVFYAIVSIIFFLIYFIKTIKREEITASDTTIYPNRIPSMDINKNSFNLAFGLIHPTKLIRFIDERIYYPEVLFIEKISQNGKVIETNKKNLIVENCRNSYFGENYQNLFEKNELNNSYCLKDYNLTLFGGIQNDKISYFQIKIFPCINSTQNNNHCRPQKEIDDFLSGSFSILAKDIGLDPFNYTFPTVPTLQDLLIRINKSIKKELIIYYGITEIETDIGLFMNKIKKEFYLKYIKGDNNFLFFDNEQYYSGKEIISLEIRLDDVIYLHKRKYTKMSQVFSTIGGYMQVLSTLLSLIVLLTKKISIEKKLLNNLFNFNFKQRKIILSIEYEKKLDFNTSMDKERIKRYIPYEAKKTIVNNGKYRRNSIIFVRNNKKLPPEIKKSFTDTNFMNDKKNNIIQNNNQNPNQNKRAENVEEIFKKIKKNNDIEGENEKDQSAMIDQSINRSKVNMITKEDNLNLNNMQINKIFESKKILWSKTNLGLLKEMTEKGNSPFINFNIFDYYCLRKITRRKTDIELFNFGINFYKRQMDIINFFNIIILTQILLIKNSGQKRLSHTIELSIK